MMQASVVIQLKSDSIQFNNSVNNLDPNFDF